MTVADGVLVGCAPGKRSGALSCSVAPLRIVRLILALPWTRRPSFHFGMPARTLATVAKHLTAKERWAVLRRGRHRSRRSWDPVEHAANPGRPRVDHTRQRYPPPRADGYRARRARRAARTRDQVGGMTASPVTEQQHEILLKMAAAQELLAKRRVGSKPASS
jgi:hypothetical protein